MSTSAALGHKRGRTSYDANIGELVDIDYALGRAIDTLSNSGFSESIDEVAAVKKVLVDAQDEIKYVQELRQANATYDIKAIPFSDMNSSHYDRLNIFPRNKITAANFKIAVDKLNTKQFPSAPSWDYTALRRGLDLIKGYVNTEHEAGCRMNIDQFIFAVMEYCKGAKMPIIYVIPELQISRKTKTKAAVSIRTATELTFITGSTDYGLLSVSGNPIDHPVHKIMRVKNVEESGTLFTFTGRHFILIEAKGKGKLEVHIPQVVAQGLAIWKLLGILEVPFCLTDGSSWIFGLLHCDESKCVLWRSAELTLDKGDYDYGKLIHPLFSWTMCSGTQIREMFEGSTK